MDFKKLASFQLVRGGRTHPGEGLCAMQAIAWLQGLEHTAHPETACGAIASLVIGINDNSNHAQRQRLIPYLPRIANSQHPETTQIRLDMCNIRRDKLLYELGQSEGQGAAHREAMDACLQLLEEMLATVPDLEEGFNKDLGERVISYREMVAQYQKKTTAEKLRETNEMQYAQHIKTAKNWTPPPKLVPKYVSAGLKSKAITLLKG